MRVGLFTDTYFPQVSGVATSIRTLKTELEKLGHTVFIFTTTDKDVNRYEDWQIIRIPSVPFFAFKDRRVAYRGFSKALAIAKQYQLDIIHTQTEFSLGLLGVWIGRELRIPVIHTYHTQYEDYVRYIARGMVIRPSMVKYIVRSYMNDLDGVICPSEIVYDLLQKYKVKAEKRIIPTGIDLAKFDRPEITPTETAALREKYEVAEDETLLLSLSRVSYEKNIQAVIAALPDVLKVNPKVKLIVAGDGPYLDDLKKQAAKLGISDAVVFTGMIDQYFDYKHGELEYRSLRFEHEVLDEENHQGNAVVNYTEREIPYTRIIEHKHFEYGTQPKTVITREYPADWKRGDEPYYPINDEKNNAMFAKYQEEAAKNEKVIFCGRLADYKYYDMHVVIERALEVVANEFD